MVSDILFAGRTEPLHLQNDTSTCCDFLLHHAQGILLYDQVLTLTLTCPVSGAMEAEGENVIYVQVDEHGRVINYTTNMPGGEQVKSCVNFSLKMVDVQSYMF